VNKYIRLDLILQIRYSNYCWNPKGYLVTRTLKIQQQRKNMAKSAIVTVSSQKQVEKPIREAILQEAFRLKGLDGQMTRRNRRTALHEFVEARFRIRLRTRAVNQFFENATSPPESRDLRRRSNA